MISRVAFFGLSLAGAGMVSGCTGIGVFFDHTTKWFDENPNSPVGGSETFQEIRGQTVDVPPLMPEKGNVWPENQGPDQTLEDLEKQQAEEIRHGSAQTGSVPPRGANQGQSPPGGQPGQSPSGQPGQSRSGQPAQQPLVVQPGQPPSNLGGRAQSTPNGPALNTTGGARNRGYRGLGTGPGSPGSGSVLVPNGNGTSTLIGPDGSVQTVPTKP